MNKIEDKYNHALNIIRAKYNNCFIPSAYCYKGNWIFTIGNENPYLFGGFSVMVDNNDKIFLIDDIVNSLNNKEFLKAQANYRVVDNRDFEKLLRNYKHID